MKKHRKLNLNKVRIVSLKNMHSVLGGNTAACPTTFSDSKQNCQGDPTGASDNGCSTGTGDPGQYQSTSNTFSAAPDPLFSGANTNCNFDDTLQG